MENYGFYDVLARCAYGSAWLGDFQRLELQSVRLLENGLSR